jgi:TolB protein
MTGPGTDGEQGPPPEHAGSGAPRRVRSAVPLRLAGVVVAAAAVLTAGVMAWQNAGHAVASPSSRAPSASPASPASSAAASAFSATPSTPASAPSSSPAAQSGAPGGSLIAVIDGSGALATMDGGGGSVVSHAVPGVVFGFPAWSPDGSRIATVGYGPDDTSIYVFSVRRAGTTGNAGPVVIYRSPDRPPFYLYWTPGGRTIAFLATEPSGLSLRIAPADGTAPLDGSGPGAIIRRGAPLYFDWEAADRLLLHVGSGSGSFVGEVGLDGASVAPAVPGTGDFRSASASRDGRYLAYVRSGTGSAGRIVVASRAGGGQHEVPVFGPAAFAFDPTGDTLASIAADKPESAVLGFPLGPLRLTDARSGATRTLLDGSVIGFFWAPDGRTIAALRLVPAGGQTADTHPILAAAAMAPPLAAATPAPGPELHVVFVGASTGAVRSDRVVRLASQFVDALLPYFDQYALSHRLWSPDSASILLPLVDSNGRTQLVVVPADGAAGRPIADGVSGFWSP